MSKTNEKFPEARFADCLECVFYRPFNTSKKCRGCEIGENFKEIVEELEPDNDQFLSRANGGFYDTE